MEFCKRIWTEKEVERWEGFRSGKKLRKLKIALKEWNKEVFGDVRVRKGDLMVKIDHVDRKEETRGLDDRVERREL